MRATFVILGGLLILQSSSELNLVKALYVFGVLVSLFFSLLQPRRLADPSVTKAAAALAVVVLVSLVPAALNGTPVTAWLRSAAPYLLLAAAPLLAADFSRAGQRFVTRLFLFAGAIAVLSFTAEWSRKHGIILGPVDQFALSSFMLASSLFVFACAHLILARRMQLRWIAVAAVVVLALFLTGSRTSLALLAAPLVMFVTPGARERQRTVKGLKLALAGSATVACIVLVGGSTWAPFLGEASNRVVSVVPQRGTAATEGSVATRRVVTDLAWHTFVSDPIVGVGLGHRWNYVLPYATPSGYGTHVTKPSIDTVVEAPATIGIVGIGILAFFFWHIVRYAWRRSNNVAAQSLIGLLAVLVLYGLTTNPFNEKGLALALTLLLAMRMANREGPATQPVDPKQPG